jgi:hypothetical protein
MPDDELLVAAEEVSKMTQAAAEMTQAAAEEASEGFFAPPVL